jgi:hypothetical protein
VIIREVVLPGVLKMILAFPPVALADPPPPPRPPPLIAMAPDCELLLAVPVPVAVCATEMPGIPIRINPASRSDFFIVCL